MQITIRDFGPEDGESFLRVHHSAVRSIAAMDYPPEVIESWAPSINATALSQLLENPDGEHRVIAESNGTAVGIGAIAVAKCELRAWHVAPEDDPARGRISYCPAPRRPGAAASSSSFATGLFYHGCGVLRVTRISESRARPARPLVRYFHGLRQNAKGLLKTLAQPLRGFA